MADYPEEPIPAHAPQPDKSFSNSLFKPEPDNDAYTNYILGINYAGGHGVPQDLIESFSWFYRAAEQGHAESQAIVGIMYQVGEAVAQDDGKSEWWLI